MSFNKWNILCCLSLRIFYKFCCHWQRMDFIVGCCGLLLLLLFTKCIVRLGIMLCVCVCVCRAMHAAFVSPAKVMQCSLVKFVMQLCLNFCCYLYRHLASEGIVMLGVMLCVCLPSCWCHVLTARHISLDGEGNALYPVLSSCVVFITFPCDNFWQSCRCCFVASTLSCITLPLQWWWRHMEVTAICQWLIGRCCRYVRLAV